MRIDITQSGADTMNKVAAIRRALKRDIGDMQKMIENANHTISMAKLTLVHLDMQADAKNWSTAS